MGNSFLVIITVIPCHTRDFCRGSIVRQTSVKLFFFFFIFIYFFFLFKTSVKLDPWETLCCLARDWKFTLIFNKVVKSACFALSNQCAICRLCLPEVWWWECKNELLKEWFIPFVWFFFCRCFDKIISKHLLWHILACILVQMLPFFNGLESRF